MTDEALAAIEQRVQAATPGPWHAPGMGEVHTDHDNGVFVGKDSDGEDECVLADLCTQPNGDADAQFIAHAREDVPALLAEVQRLRKVCADVEGELPASCRVVNGDTKAIDLAASVATLERLRRGAIEMHLR